MIKAIDIYKSFGNLEVLKGISLTIEKGEIVTIVGKSGAGKTTLLQILGTLLHPTKGKVYINNIDVFNLSDIEISKFRNKHIGFVFQFHHLLPEFTALENVCLPAYIAGVSKPEAEAKAIELLTFMNLNDRLHHKPNELSGGEQQRVAVARALINQPDVVLADEPSGNLDSTHKTELHKLFFYLREKYNQTFIIVTHDENLASMSDRMLHIKDGILVS